jgi:DNA helicase-2/ATP-dependent DNA helicase PcrA
VAFSCKGRGSCPSCEDEDQSSSTGLKVGLRVRHKQFGIGNIIGVEEQGDDTRVTVRFNAVGVKKLVARYAALEKA